jgi:hypothetical protein
MTWPLIDSPPLWLLFLAALLFLAGLLAGPGC